MSIDHFIQGFLPVADQHVKIVRAGVDATALGALLSTFIGWMGPIGAVLAVLWYAAQLYESKFVQDIIAKYRKPAAPVPPQSPSATEQEPSKPA